MLTIVTLAYASQPVEALRIHRTPTERQQQLLATYVDRMFQRRSPITYHTRQQTERWLAWLAWQMAQHSQTDFYLERLQPDWLPVGRRWLPTQGARLLAGLVGLLAGLGVGLAFGLLVGLVYKLSTSLAAGLSGGEISTKTVPNEGIHRSARMAVSTGPVGGLIGGLVFGLGFGLLGGLFVVLLGGLGAGLFVGLATGLRSCCKTLSEVS
jgi:hypothetical protein